MKEYLLVDGYNVIFGWPELKTLGSQSLEHARLELQSLLQNYGRYKGYEEVLLVFDGKKGGCAGTEEVLTKDFTIVYTSRGETADSYIEKAVSERVGKFKSVYVVTSDKAEQHQILGSGGLRIPVRELRAAVLAAKDEERQLYEDSQRTAPKQIRRNTIGSFVTDDRVAKAIEDIIRNG